MPLCQENWVRIPNTAKLGGMPNQTPIIWINGPFGIGKSQAAQALNERLAGSFLFDPEEMGQALKKLTPKFRGDFQNHPMWIPLMLDALQYAAREADGPLIVPVTIDDAARHRRLMSGLKDRGIAVHHFTLMASPEAIQARLRRGEEINVAELQAKLNDFKGEAFARHIEVGERTPNALAEEIAAQVGLTLGPVQSDPFRWLKNLGGRR